MYPRIELFQWELYIKYSIYHDLKYNDNSY